MSGTVGKVEHKKNQLLYHYNLCEYEYARPEWGITIAGVTYEAYTYRDTMEPVCDLYAEQNGTTFVI